VLNAFTVDVEDWYHICGVEKFISPTMWNELESRVNIGTEKILNMLSKKNIKGTFFILGYIAELYPDMVKIIFREGHEIATHGYSHETVYKLTHEEFKEDLRKSIDILKNITGQNISGYRAPEWSIRKDSYWALNIIKEEGLLYDSSVTPSWIIGDPEALPFPHQVETDNGLLHIFPPSTFKSPMGQLPFTGSWIMRLLPYNIIKKKVQKLNKINIPAIAYLHSWEMDVDHPKIKLPWAKEFVHYVNLKECEDKFNRLIDDFNFGTIRDIIKNNNHDYIKIKLDSIMTNSF
jgi:polysaccharide deacetylase family protein (PEP-CTERM system associated)